MICYKDRTFCASDCTNSACFRHYGDEEKRGAILWWGSEGAPIAFADFSDRCSDYQAPGSLTEDR